MTFTGKNIFKWKLGVSLKFSLEILINQNVGEKLPGVLFQSSTLLVCVDPG